MPVEFLSDDQLAVYGQFAFPVSRADLERFFFLDDRTKDQPPPCPKHQPCPSQKKQPQNPGKTLAKKIGPLIDEVQRLQNQESRVRKLVSLLHRDTRVKTIYSEIRRSIAGRISDALDGK